MKQIFTLLLITSCYFLSAQSAPDFTLTDLNGESFNLYEKLGENKAVLIDFSTTWCGPCWSLHKSGLLEDVYEELGPNGEDVLDVVWIESDPQTNDDCLKGLSTCNNSTQGDWVEGTTFRMFNPSDNSVPSAYPVSGYPTVILVSAIDGEIILSKNFPSKEEIVNAVHLNGYVYDNLELEILEFETPPSVCENVNSSVRIRNKSKVSAEDTKVNLLVDDVVVATKTIDGTFSKGQEVVLEFNDIPLTSNVSTLKVEIDIEDEVSSNNKRVAVVGKKSFDSKVSISIKKNTLKGKTQFSLLDSKGNIVFESGSIYPGKDYEKEILVSELGCTNIVFFDSFKKGITGDPHALVIKDSEGKTIFDGELDLKNGSLNIGYNTSQYSSIEDIEQLEGLELTPNPVNDMFTLDVELSQSAEVKTVILNSLGQVISERVIGKLSVGTHSYTFQAQDFNAGIYYMQVEIEGKKETRKFVKN